MRIICIIILLITCTLAQGQENFNMESIATIELNEPGNDIWGYVDSTGLEYAVMGSRNNTRIWSLEDPSIPIERAVIPGFATTWRDIKTFEDHIYVTNDGDPRDGLLVIDMSMAPDSISYEYTKPIIFVEPQEVTQVILDTIDFTTATDTTFVIDGLDTIATNITIDTTYNVSERDTMITIQDTTLLGQCHNLFIDENGFCYLSGCRINNANKAIIFDLNQDKKNPPIVGIHGGPNWQDGEYSHDLFVQNDIMYSSEINAGVLTLFDVTDKANIVELGDARTTMDFTHNTWASTDGRYAFTTDERANAFVDAYDVSDPGNIIRLDSYQPLETAGTGVIPHNTHYKDGFLITSWYTDGVVITDVNMPDNMIKVGAYDTYPIPGNGFNGCWGAYPWLPSGLVITSNITNVNGLGQLDIFRPTYVRAAYLHGTVTDIDDGSTINGVDIVINNPDQANEGRTNPLGEYKTGIESAGTYEVTFTHPDYFPETLTTTIENGVVTVLDAQLTKRPQVTITGTVIDGVTSDPIPNALLKISNQNRLIEITTDDQGQFDQTIFDENYDVIVGAWGYRYATINKKFDGATGEVFRLEPGIEDNFALDLGWEVNGNVSTGLWVRDVPIPTFRYGVAINVSEDITGDIGDECYMTGNGGGDAASDDVDDGVTRLLSPKFNVSQYSDPLLQFNAWFTIGGGQGPINDTMFVRIWDKTALTTLAMYTESTGGWTDVVSIPLNGLVDTDADLSISVVISDLPGTGHLLEGGFDDFRIVEGMPSSAVSISENDNIEIYPNPFTDNINILLDADNYKTMSLYDIMGKQVYRSKVINNQTVIGRELTKGFYTIILEKKDGTLLSKKLIKQ